MRRGMIFSAGLHIAVIILAVLGLPVLFDRAPTADPPITVEMVRISDKTRMLPAPPKPKPKPSPKRPVKPKPEPVKPKTAALPPPPPPDLAKLEPVPVPKPKPKVKPKVKVKKPPPKPKIKKQKRRQPRLAKIKPRHKPLAPREDFVDSVLKDVSKEKPREKEKKPDKKIVKKAEPAPPRPSLDQRLTISELDSIRRQIEACWSIPAGARDAENLIVDISVIMNPDGTVQRAEIVDRSRLTGDPFYRAAAESALRAVLHPRCSPLRLPPQKYRQWRRFTLSFNPKELIGS